MLPHAPSSACFGEALMSTNDAIPFRNVNALKLSVAAVVMALIGVTVPSNSAQARCSSGEIANVFGSITGNCDMARTLDKAHDDLGRPLDQAAPAIAGAVAGPYGYTAAQTWQTYDQMRRMQANVGAGGFQPAAMGQPTPPWSGSQMSQMPNVCRTPVGACTLTPGPVGVPCSCSGIGGISTAY